MSLYIADWDRQTGTGRYRDACASKNTTLAYSIIQKMSENKV